jgi:hypothetical protein
MRGKGVPLIFIIVLLCGLCGVVGCGAPAIAPTWLVPDDVKFVASIQINKILTDQDLIAAYDEALNKPLFMPGTFEDALKQVEEEIGIDPRDFSEVLIFGDTESDDYFGATIKGTFDPEALIESVEEAIGEEMAHSTYKGYQIYTTAFEDEEVAICFLSDDTVALGLTNVVKDIIDVNQGDKERLSGRLYDTYTAFGDVWIKGAGEVPEGAIDDIPEVGIPIDLEILEDLEVVGFAFNKAGENLTLQIELCFSDAESAADVQDMISVIVIFLPLIMPDIPTEVADLLDWLSFSQSDSCITITLETTTTDIEELIESIVEEVSEH